MNHETQFAAVRPTINVINIRKVADAIESGSLPRRYLFGLLPGGDAGPKLGFNMAAWFSRYGFVRDRSGRRNEDVGCIATWAYLVAHPGCSLDRASRLATNNLVDGAAKFMGLDDRESHYVFGGYWHRGSSLNDISVYATVRYLRRLATAGVVDLRGPAVA